MSLIDSFSRVSAPKLPRIDGLIPWIVPLAIILIWQLACVTGFVSARVLPAPSDVALAGWKLLLSGELARNIWVSFWRASIGFLIGGSIGFSFGLANGLSQTLQQADRHDVADGAQHPASGADPARHPVVRHR